MHKFITRIVAAALIPCFMGDPVVATAILQPPDRTSYAATAERHVFDRQALCGAVGVFTRPAVIRHAGLTVIGLAATAWAFHQQDARTSVAVAIGILAWLMAEIPDPTAPLQVTRLFDATSPEPIILGERFWTTGLSTLYKLSSRDGPVIIKVPHFFDVYATREEAILAALSGTPHFPQFIKTVWVRTRSNSETRKGFVMRQIPGERLDTFLNHQPNQRLEAHQAVDVALQIAAALERVHTLQPPMLHGDIKPGNVMVHPDSVSGSLYATVFDFNAASAHNEINPTLTARSASPEHLSNAIPLTAASDIYEVGLLLFFMLTGSEAFPLDGFPDLLRLKREVGLTPAALHHIPMEALTSGIVELLRRMLTYAPEERLTLTQLEEALTDIRQRLEAAPKTSQPTNADFSNGRVRADVSYPDGTEVFYLRADAARLKGPRQYSWRKDLRVAVLTHPAPGPADWIGVLSFTGAAAAATRRGERDINRIRLTPAPLRERLIRLADQYIPHEIDQWIEMYPPLSRPWRERAGGHWALAHQIRRDLIAHSLLWSLVPAPLAWLGFVATTYGFSRHYIRPGSASSPRGLDRIARAVERAEARGESVTISLAGESVHSEVEAEQMVSDYERFAEYALARWGDSHLERHVAVKLSGLQPAFDPQNPVHLERVAERVTRIAEAMRRAGLYLEIDGERYDVREAQRALTHQIQEKLPGWNGVGLAIQAYFKDADRVVAEEIDLARRKGRVTGIRLVKGAYWQKEFDAGHPVWPTLDETHRAFRSLAVEMLRAPDAVKVMFASMNPREHAWVTTVAHTLGLSQDQWEHQMLWGMQEEYGRELLRQGARLRRYVVLGDVVPALAYFGRRREEFSAPYAASRIVHERSVPAREAARIDPILFPLGWLVGRGLSGLPAGQIRLSHLLVGIGMNLIALLMQYRTPIIRKSLGLLRSA